MKRKNNFLLLLMCAAMYSCTDPIDVTLPDAEPLLVVDAWINNLEEEQKIKLTLSSPFFDNAQAPAVSGAEVVITNNNNEQFRFIESGSSGVYIWFDSTETSFGKIGDNYTLDIVTADGVYQAESKMNNVPPVDSFTYEEYDPAFVDEIIEEGWEAQFYATDLPGVGDTYWIKAYKNNRFLSKPQEINLAFDAAFDGGSVVDGIPFIAPTRFAINRIPDDEDVSNDTNKKAPYKTGDIIKVEIHAITNEAFNFMNQARIQMTLGDNTIFAPPLTNVPTNIERVAGELKVVGFFNVASVSSREEIVP